jgi:hypothetical protein
LLFGAHHPSALPNFPDVGDSLPVTLLAAGRGKLHDLRNSGAVSATRQ